MDPSIRNEARTTIAGTTSAGDRNSAEIDSSEPSPAALRSR